MVTTVSTKKYCTQKILLTDNKHPREITITLPKGFTAHYLTETLQGGIYVIIKVENDKVEKYALKQAFKTLVKQNKSLNGVTICENMKKEYDMLQHFQNLDGCIKLMHSWYEDEHSYYYSTEYAGHGDLLRYINYLKHRLYLEKQKANQISNQNNIDNETALSLTKFFPYQKFTMNLIPFIFGKLCQNIYDLHAQSCAHLDISLENIVLMIESKEIEDEEKEEEKEPDNKDDDIFNHNINTKLIDFGLSQIFGYHDSDSHIFEFNNQIIYDRFCGKEYYYSPEVWSTHLNHFNPHLHHIYNPFKADIWSLGVILYVLYSDRYPFLPKNVQAHKGYNLSQVQYFDIMPQEAIDLMKKIFVPENQRLDIVQIMQHPFVGLLPTLDGCAKKNSLSSMSDSTI